VRAGIEITEARTTLLIGFAAIRRMLRGLEATTKIAFVLLEVSALRLVRFFLRIAEGKLLGFRKVPYTNGRSGEERTNNLHGKTSSDAAGS
jgi:hypothetical protein